MKSRIFLTLLITSITCGCAFLIGCSSGQTFGSYRGVPYGDSVHKAGAQSIPGKLQCEYYDLGGEGIAYHDADSINSGSGRLNPADGSC